VILVLASDADQHARQFALANQGENIKILSCRQIACAAMALYSSSRAGSFVSIDEELIPLER
jgi:hypothetical protein